MAEGLIRRLDGSETAQQGHWRERLDAAEHAKMLADFKSGAIDSEIADYVGDLSEQDMADIAAYYATLPGK